MLEFWPPVCVKGHFLSRDSQPWSKRAASSRLVLHAGCSSHWPRCQGYSRTEFSGWLRRPLALASASVDPKTQKKIRVTGTGFGSWFPKFLLSLHVWLCQFPSKSGVLTISFGRWQEKGHSRNLIYILEVKDNFQIFFSVQLKICPRLSSWDYCVFGHFFVDFLPVSWSSSFCEMQFFLLVCEAFFERRSGSKTDGQNQASDSRGITCTLGLSGSINLSSPRAVGSILLGGSTWDPEAHKMLISFSFFTFAWRLFLSFSWLGHITVRI